MWRASSASADLLYEEGFTIAGAREKLREEARLHQMAAPSKVAATGQIREIVNAKVHPGHGATHAAVLTTLRHAAGASRGVQKLRRQLRAMLDCFNNF